MHPWVGPVFYTTSYLGFEVQIMVIWFHLRRKSELLTNCIDLINRDTLTFHNVAFSLGIWFSFLTHQFHGKNPDYIPTFFKWIILCFSLAFLILALMTFLYYSLGITLRYYLIITKQNCISEDWTDGDIRITTRYVIATIAASAAVLSAVNGGYPDFYYDLTHEPIRNEIALGIAIGFLSLSIVLNIIFRCLIFIRKKKYLQEDEFNEKLYQSNHRNHHNHQQQRYYRVGLSVLGLVCCFIFFMVSLIFYREEKDKKLIIRMFGVTFSGNSPLFIYIITNQALINGIKTWFKNLVPKKTTRIAP